MNRNMSLVILFVGSVLVLDVAGIIFLAARSTTIPDFLQVVGGSALTGLVGLLANPNKSEQETSQ